MQVPHVGVSEMVVGGCERDGLIASKREGAKCVCVSRRQTVKIALLFRFASLFSAAFALFYEKIVFSILRLALFCFAFYFFLAS